MAAGRHVAARWIHPRLIVALTSIERSGPHSPLFYFYREAIEPVRVSARTGFILPFIFFICLRPCGPRPSPLRSGCG
jgi:hypothetical protein